MEAARCEVCGRVAVAEHHVVAECYSPRTVVPVCGECHRDLDGSLYYARVHRRDRSTAGPADRDYALVRGTGDTLMLMLRAAGSDPGLIEVLGRAQYALGQHVAAGIPPEQRIGPSPPTSGAFRIKVGRLSPNPVNERSRSLSAPDWLDRLRLSCSIWSTLMGDYTDDTELERFFRRLAEGLGNERLRAWVGSYREDDLSPVAEQLLRDLEQYVDALLQSTNGATQTVSAATRVIDSARVLAADLESILVLLVDLSRCRSVRSAQAAVDSFLARHRGPR